MNGWTYYTPQAGRDRATVTTIPIESPAGANKGLAVNIEGVAGRTGAFAVEVLDAATGEPLEGFGPGDCRAPAEDGLAVPVTWSGGDTLPPGRHIRLRFHLAAAGTRLYSFGFRTGRAAPPVTKDSALLLVNLGLVTWNFDLFIWILYGGSTTRTAFQGLWIAQKRNSLQNVLALNPHERTFMDDVKSSAVPTLVMQNKNDPWTDPAFVERYHDEPHLLCEDFADDIAGNICQPKVSPQMLIGQLFVVESK